MSDIPDDLPSIMKAAEENLEIDREIATKRSSSIMRYLNQTCHIPLSRMQAVGYGHKRYFLVRGIADEIKDDKQAIYFYIYRKAKNLTGESAASTS